MKRAVILAALVPVAARADSSSSVTVTLTQAGEQLAQCFGDSEAAFIQKAQVAVDGIYQTLRIDQVLGALMSSTAFANNELGVDHDVRPGEHFFGLVGGGAISNDTSFLTEGHVTTGAVINYNVTGGMNFGHQHHPRWTLFANAGYAEGSLYALQGHLYSGGVHVQYKAVQPTAPGGVRWIGVDVTTGGEASRWELGNGLTPIVVHFTLHANPPATASRAVTLTSNGNLSLVATTFAVPLEVSTGVRFGEHFTLYAGGGPDLVVGSATITANLNGTMATEAENTQLGTVDITASGTRSASPLTAHALVGMQLNAGHVHVYLQGIATPDVYGGTFGVRAVW